MLRAIDIKRKGAWPGEACDTVVLEFDQRHRRRLAMTGCGGMVFLLDLERTTVLRDGDGLLLEDGRVIGVSAAAEPLLQITCRDAEHLARVAWHLGNRHLPTQIAGVALLVTEDHVIAEMAEGLGAEVQRIVAPFDPEGGAYEHSHHIGPDGGRHG
ncbi:MAG: urease accessory protein UreE [Pseudomonadota bacterium]